MPEVLIFVIILSKIRHYRFKPLFFSWVFYPVLIIQIIVIVMQFSPFWGTYDLLRFAPYIQKAVLVSFLFPIFTYKLYKPAIVGSGLVIIGTMLNKFAIAQNGGHMPVFPSLSYLTGYTTPAVFGVADSLHVLGSDATRYKFLTDYIDTGYSILSVGDLLIHFFSFLMIYYMVKAVNNRIGVNNGKGKVNKVS